MAGLKFRALRADEVDCRIQSVKQNGCILLFYKDARCDQNILDETVGAMNWQRSHSRENANCTVSIWDESKNMWVSKEDTGTESNTEAAKGLASDSFKRACFNWGIGRELYTAPFVWIPEDKCSIYQRGNGYACNDRFRLAELVVENGKITACKVVNLSRNREVVFSYGSTSTSSKNRPTGPKNDEPTQEEQEVAKERTNNSPARPVDVNAIKASAKELHVNINAILQRYGVKKLEDMTFAQTQHCLKSLEATKEKRGK